MKKTFLLTLSATLLLTTPSACKKYDHAVGEDVIFSRMETSNADTRTSYGPITSSQQTVYWTNGDNVRIACAQCTTDDSAPQSATYVVTDGGGTATAVIQRSPYFAKGLRWGTGTHHFYAASPFPTGVDNTTYGRDGVTLTPTGVYTNTIPGEITCGAATDDKAGNYTYPPAMENLFLYGYAQEEAQQGSEKVFINMKPFTTVLEFTLVNNYTTSEDMVIEAASLYTQNSNMVLNGKFSSQIPSADASAGYPTVTSILSSGRANVLRVPVENRVSVAKGKSVTFTFFCVPNSDISYLFLVVDSNNSGTTVSRRLALRRAESGGQLGEWLTFKRCYKTRILGVLVPEGATWIILEEVGLAGFNQPTSQDITVY